MATRVTLRIFAGRPNPTHVLTAGEEDQFVAQFNGLAYAPGPTSLHRTGGLGYRGFLLEPISGQAPGGPAKGQVLAHPLSLYAGVADELTHTRARLDPNRSVELSLLDVVLSALNDPPLVALARKEARNMYRNPNCASGGKQGPPLSLSGRPTYSPGPWNAAAAVGSNNCYNYANNRKFTSGTAAIPGSGGGSPSLGPTCAALRAAVVADGLRALAATGSLNQPGPGPIALFLKAGGLDFHFYRQDKTGRWSHKPGSWPVRNCDERGGSILDPRSADTLDYAFCRFFETSSSATIQG